MGDLHRFRLRPRTGLRLYRRNLPHTNSGHRGRYDELAVPIIREDSGIAYTHPSSAISGMELAAVALSIYFAR